MKFLSIGGAGFVGTNFAKFIKRKQIGHVENLDNGRLSTGEISFKKFDVVEKSISDLEIWIENCDVVINFAAITRVEESLKDPWKSFSVNINIHHKICETLRIMKTKRKKIPMCLFLSTGGALAGQTDKIINEEILPKPLSTYGASKLACEALGYSYTKSYGLDIRNLRFTNIYGPYCEKKESVVARFIRNILNNEPIKVRDNGLMKRDFIYVDDVCEGILAMARNGYPGLTLQFGQGYSKSLKEIVEILQSHKSEFEIVYTNSLKGEVSNVTCDIGKAIKLINWKPKVNLEDGIKQTWNYLLQYSQNNNSLINNF